MELEYSLPCSEHPHHLSLPWSQMNLVQAFPSHFFKTHFQNILIFI